MNSDNVSSVFAEPKDTGISPVHAQEEPFMSWDPSVWRLNNKRGSKPKKTHQTRKNSTTSSSFDHRSQRQKLLASGIFKLIITLTVCALLAITILVFDKLGRGISNVERGGFNTLIVTLSILLSLNLFSSLERCAQTVRWRLLASQYHNPEQFNLIFDGDKKLNALRLLWVGRTQGRHTLNKIQLLGLVYLLVSLGLLADSAVLGLTYSIEVSEQHKLTKPGTVSVTDLGSISPLSNSWMAQLQQAQNFGLVSQGFLPIESSLGENQTKHAALLVIQYTENFALFWYQFMDLSADNLMIQRASTRYVTSNATCREVTVVSGGNVGYNQSTSEVKEESWVQIRDGDEPVQDVYIGDYQAPGATTWLGSIDPGTGSCGPRCAHLWVLQSAYPSEGREQPRFWKCTNTVSEILNMDPENDHPAFHMADDLAQAMAGAIGFSGVERRDDPFQRVLYAYSNAFAPTNDPAIINSTHIEATAMWFTAGGFAAMDAFGMRVNVTNQDQPIPALVLEVNWGRALAVLTIPPFVQALILVASLIYSNKVVVADGHAVATARLLRPVAERLNDEGGGSAATTDIVEESVGRYKIRYRAAPCR